MSSSKRDILDTEAMLDRLAALLHNHLLPGTPINGQARTDAEQLRRISMTLHRWHEMECGVESGGIDRDDDGTCWWYNSNLGRKTHKVADREAGAEKRLAKIMARYPALTAYVQTDPRGCALYILKPGDVPEGFDASSYYLRGLAVFQ